jgi:hypothetical protein
MYEMNVNPNLDRTLYSAFFLLGTLIGLIGSTIILIAIKKKAIKVDKISTTFVQHIAVLDILSTLVMILPTFLTAATDSWFLGAHFCSFQVYYEMFMVVSTALLVCALNSIKLVKVLFPFRALGWTLRYGHHLAGSVWILAITLPVIHHLRESDSYVSFNYASLKCARTSSDVQKDMVVRPLVVLVCTALVVISGTWLLGIAIRRNRQQGRSANLQGILTVLLVAGVYCVTFLPLFVCYVVNLVSFQTGRTYAIFVLFAEWTPCINNIANIFVYTASLTSFRDFLKNEFFAFLTCIGARKRPNHTERRSAQTLNTFLRSSTL